MNLDVRVLTPNRVICSTFAQEVILPGLTGLVGVLEGHATLITALDIGILRIKSDQTWTPIILITLSIAPSSIIHLAPLAISSAG